MDPLRHDPDHDRLAHLADASRLLALPIEASGLAWHPFGVYGIPLAKRIAEDGTAYSRRLHIWHPEAIPVGEASIYGVHTHSGTAHSHVLVGTLQHHLYEFFEDPDGVWKRTAKGDVTWATLGEHLQAPTHAGTTHTLPANQAHGVTKPPGFAISLFEQVGDDRREPFTTWQRTDVPKEELVLSGPVSARQVRAEARKLIEEALYATEQTLETPRR